MRSKLSMKRNFNVCEEQKNIWSHLKNKNADKYKFGIVF